MRFGVEGPFDLSRHGDKKLIGPQSLTDLRAELHARREGLAQACGCYVFAIRAGGGYTPHYVGQACATTLAAESMNPSNRGKYNAVECKRGQPVMFFLPLLTATGRFRRRPKEGKLEEIDFLEKWLIAACLEKNPNLQNNKQTRHMRGVSVAGILNSKQGSASLASAALKAAIF